VENSKRVDGIDRALRNHARKGTKITMNRLTRPLSFIVTATALLLTLAGAVSQSRAETLKTEVLNPRALPLGDGKISTTARRGYVFSCSTQFHGGGAQRDGDWITGDTWDLTRKISVQGDVAWPNARFTLTETENERRLSGNGLPINHTTGTFPVRSADPAYRIDRNPNTITEQQIMFALPQAPVVASTPSCVPMGMIGVALSGVAIFNALDGQGRDAVAHEVLDRCHGHPQREGQYHYHGPSHCVPGGSGNNTLVGYALDGFGIYSGYDANGREIVNADLDECHGRVSPILWNGKEVNMYHYVLTREYPYTVGCFRGNAVRVSSSRAGNSGPPTRGGMSGPGPGGPRQPPAEALAACEQKVANAACRFSTPQGDTRAGGCRAVPAASGAVLACVPERP